MMGFCHHNTEWYRIVLYSIVRYCIARRVAGAETKGATQVSKARVPLVAFFYVVAQECRASFTAEGREHERRLTASTCRYNPTTR